MKFEFLETPEAAEITKPLETVTQLEPGVVLERIGNAETVSETASENIIGDYENDSEYWHRQAEKCSCAICCQEFIAEQLLGGDFSEKKMCDYAFEKGWYTPETGTYMRNIGKILKKLGLEVERDFGQDLNDIAQAISEGSKVICGVNYLSMYKPEAADIPDAAFNHAVQVIGIDLTDLDNAEIILNDSDHPNGKGIRVNAEDFLKSWSFSNNYMVTVSRRD